MIARTLASAPLPLKNGELCITVFNLGDSASEHVALVKGDVSGVEHVPTYIHSECLLGDRFGSLGCDCRALLDWAIKWLGTAARGVIIYISPHPSSRGSIFVACAAPPSAANRSIASAILQELGARSAHVVSREGSPVEPLTWGGT